MPTITLPKNEDLTLETDNCINSALRRINPLRRERVGRHLIAADASVLECLEALNALPGGSMTLFAVDADGRLCGSLTDGDLRRAMIGGLQLSGMAEAACNRGCIHIGHDDDRYLIVTRARRMGITLLPVVEEGYVIDIIDLRDMKTALPIDAVLMAGGKGERLRPLTLDTPKPLLPVGGIPIIDYNIRELLRNGAERIFVTVNYLKEKIIDHISATYPPGSGQIVECVAEPCRLGTIGSLALVDGLRHDSILVMNSDLLTNIDFEKLYLKHLESDADMTMAVIPYSVSIPFAIIEHEDDRLTGLSEKPTYNYYANAGIYMIRRDVIKEISKGSYMDATDLVELLLKKNRKVCHFPIEGTWIDIGSPDDYRHACEMLRMTPPRAL